ncbi:hypothetical protein LOD99_10304 [Oopsacas minuta]|uniref:protein acetyllysine N-acetyltransferase n=1 Tax=Oopsacas minuta TaxID=111878 RepID=A0AAV7KHN8_9METZ|nr:hypothetical protein LOD99_10304 [Oopsacas minuta]
MANTVDLDEIEEFEDKPADLEVKIKKLANMVRDCKHLVVFTGAGISTSASIPDYRGPNGVWTLKAQGKKPKARTSFDDAIPTPCHMTLKELQDRNILKYVVSQNVDGLHRRSGIRKECISELHGNCYLEVCWSCSYEQLRHKEVRMKPNPFNGRCKPCLKRVPHFCHCTLDKCVKCKTPMRDSIIHFGENLPEKALALAYENGREADIMIVLGSSLRVSPANDVPEETVGKGGKLVIVNLQKTPLDGSAALRIFARTDLVCQMLMKELAIPIPQFIPHRIIYIGNTHEEISTGKQSAVDSESATEKKSSHKWTVYLRGEPGTDLTPFIGAVSFHLHTTFKPDVITLYKPPYEVTKVGWGIFNVNLVVELNNGMISEYNHMLDFNQENVSTKETLFLQQGPPEMIEEGTDQL